MLNQARLKALKVREDHVRDVLDEAKRRLTEIPKNEAKYVDLLRKLLIQGLLQVGDSYFAIGLNYPELLNFLYNSSFWKRMFCFVFEKRIRLSCKD